MNKTEFYSPTQAEHQLAESMLTEEQRKMSDRRANEFKEQPHFIERGQIWSITNSLGEDLGDVVVQSCMGADEDDYEFEKENPGIQFFTITKDIENTWEGSLLLTGEESPLGEDFAINTVFTGRVFARHLKEYKGFLGKELTDKMMFVFIKEICGCHTDEEREKLSKIKTGKPLESDTGPRAEAMKSELNKVNYASAEYDQNFFENMSRLEQENASDTDEEDMFIEYEPSEIENCDPRLDEGNLFEQQVEKWDDQLHKSYNKIKGGKNHGK
jgi:hypothetical protein